MHVFNAWLPPPVAELTHLETQAFSEAVRLLQRDCSAPQLSASPYASLKWISILNNFLKSKSDLVISDVELFITVVLNLFLHGEENYYLQARWGSLLHKYLKKFAKKLSLTLHWRPLYDVFLRSVFVRRNSFEGFGLQAAHVNSLSNIIRKCRRFFPKGSAAEIWAEFRPMLEDLSHNTSLEAAGFISLFLPTNSEADSEFFTSEWFAECLGLWDGVPYCQYWNSQWASLAGRCIKKSFCMPNLNVEQFVPILFSRFLRSFEVPVGKTSGVFPYQREVTREIVLAFSSDWSHSLPKDIAKSIVYLLKPNGSTERHLSCMVDLLEQYYHPSNGGRWTSSLERFLRHIVALFLKRLAKEDRKPSDLRETPSEHAYLLTSKERRSFVEIIMRLIERGQFSKSSSLANTAAKAASALAYIEPALVLPLSITSFHTALDSITATHQLEAAIKTLALSARTLLMGSAMSIELPNTQSSNELVANCKNTLELALFETLSGLDANDPPKTIAALQFFCSVFSSLEKIETDDEGLSSVLAVNWSEWLDIFLERLLSLLLHLESTNHLVGALESDKPSFSKSFLVQGDSFYFSTLELLFSRLPKALYEQALKKVAKFVHNHTLTGAVSEIGLLCSAVVYASPLQGIHDLIRPIMSSVLSSLNDCPPTGFSGVPNSQAVFDLKTTLSPALESSIVYQLNLVSLGLMYGGEHVIQCKDLLKKIIAASFDAPSAKVNEAGSLLLTSIIGCVILFYPLDQYRLYQKYTGLEGIEEWLSTKPDSGFDKTDGPIWHLPSANEISFANELLDLHLKGALAELKSICVHSNSEISSSPAGTAQEKEHLRVVLIRIDASLRGVRSCLPDFKSSQSRSLVDGERVQPYFISGAIGVPVGSVDLREDAAETLHLACNYFLRKWADDIVLLSLLAHSIAVVGNSGALEFSEWSSAKDSSRTELKNLVEPPINYMTGHHVKGQRRPRWLVIELLLVHNVWRASQSHYNWYRATHDDNHEAPHHVILLAEDLTKLSLHNYDAVRKMAAASLKKVFKQYPSSIKESMPVLLKSLQDSLAPEHAALGSCALLASRPIARYLTENFGALWSFFLAVLNSAHHGSVKAQDAINELFSAFIVRFGGLPYQKEATSGYSESYADIATKIQSFCSNIDTTHWRYNLMAQGMLILLSARGANATCCQGDADRNILNNIRGHFLLNLKSEFPPLRPMSIGSLLFLLQPSSNKRESSADLEDAQKSEESASSSLKSLLGSILSQEDYGSVVFRNISVDHHFSDGQMRSRQGGIGRAVAPFDDSAISMLWVPGNIRSWPRTRTLDSTMKGDGFSSKYAKLFKRLVQECGLAALEAFRGPLQGAASELEERGMQCAAAEVIAGFLHSDMGCVSMAWDEWLQPLLKKLLTYSSVESTTEWAACIRFALTGKGRLGRRPPLTRPMVLQCLLEPVPPTASSNALVKHFTFLCAALVEIPPSEESSDELSFHQQLLLEALKFVRHSAPQVRDVVGMAICIAGANLEGSNLSSEKTRVAVASSKETTSEETIEWKTFITSETISEAVKCQSYTIQGNEADVSMENVINDGSFTQKGDDLQDAVRFTETVLYFLISTLKSGRSMTLMNVIIELLQPVLSLQETSHKDLSSLAKVALQFLKFQVFPTTHLSKAVSALLAAANDSNWHTRVASLSFLQSFMYRHTFLLPMDIVVKIWGEVKNLLSDAQLEVRELASVTLAGMMKGSYGQLSKEFYENQLEIATSYVNRSKSKRGKKASTVGTTSTDVHAVVLGLSACVQSVPYDMPSWLPKVITTLAQFSKDASPTVRATVRKGIAEFRRTHADTWAIQKLMFNEEELEILTDTSSSASYFA
eukprot:c17405_g1_i1 orf=311-5854(-)